MNRVWAAFAALILLVFSVVGAACTDALARSDVLPHPRDGADPTLDQLAELMTGWQDGIVSMQVHSRTVVASADGEIVMDSRQETLVDLRTWTIYTVADIAPLSEAGSEEAFEVLARTDGIYTTPAPEIGWLRVGNGVDIGEIADSMQASGFAADLLSDPRIQPEFEAGSLNGRDAWVVRVAISPDLLDDPRLQEATLGAAGEQFIATEYSPGIDSFFGGIDIVSVVYIDPLTGAPLRSETAFTIDFGEGPLKMAITADIFGWNVPLDLPEPEPLLDEDEAEAAFDAAVAS